MALTVAALAQLLLGAALLLLGRWGRRSADLLVSPRLDPEEHRARADGVARGGLFCQAIGLLLLVFALGTAIAALAGVDPTLRPE